MDNCRQMVALFAVTLLAHCVCASGSSSLRQSGRQVVFQPDARTQPVEVRAGMVPPLDQVFWDGVSGRWTLVPSHDPPGKFVFEINVPMPGTAPSDSGGAWRFISSQKRKRNSIDEDDEATDDEGEARKRRKMKRKRERKRRESHFRRGYQAGVLGALNPDSDGDRRLQSLWDPGSGFGSDYGFGMQDRLASVLGTSGVVVQPKFHMMNGQPHHYSVEELLRRLNMQNSREISSSNLLQGQRTHDILYVDGRPLMNVLQLNESPKRKTSVAAPPAGHLKKWTSLTEPSMVDAETQT